MQDAIQRAKHVLDLCGFELKHVSIGDQMTLEQAIATEIEMAQIDILREYNSAKATDKKMGKITHLQDWLMKIRARSKR